MFSPLLGWEEYLEIVLVCAFVYYAIFYFRYYHKQSRFVEGAIRPQELSKGTFVSETFPQGSDKQFIRNDQAQQTHIVHDLVDELQALLKQMGLQASTKEELLKALKRLVKKYPSIKTSGLVLSINDLIVSETARHIHCTLAHSDLKELWL